ncbi:MAG: pseudouridine synthase [Pseudomonadota bacterium]
MYPAAMSISPYPSQVTLPGTPDRNWAKILDFLCHRFPRVSPGTWRNRICKGRVLDAQNIPISLESPYIPGACILYFKECPQERAIPFRETIVFRNDHLLVACKPHFLPVMPAGSHVNETLLLRLKDRFQNPDLVPIHRIDSETAGLVLFSTDKKTRGDFQRLFMKRQVEKTYEAITLWPPGLPVKPFRLEHRIAKGEPWFISKIVQGEPNAITDVEPITVKNGRAHLRLQPITGKKHQLRLQLGSIGCQIINDRYYPDLKEKAPPDFETPLQLLARQISFTDPLSFEYRVFVSDRQLMEN